MRILIILTSIYSFQFCFAGGSQVGTLKTANPENSSVGNFKTNTLLIRDISQIKNDPSVKIIYAIDNKDGISEFAAGKSVNGAWDIQKYAIPSSTINQTEFSQILNESKNTSDWVKVQN